MRRDIYMAVMVAAANGRGLHLTADEVFLLSLDDAVSTYAANALSEREFERYAEDPNFWATIKPFVRQDAANLAGFSRDDPARVPRSKLR